MTDKLSDIATIITDNYLKDKPTASFVNCIYEGANGGWSYDFFYNLRGKKVENSFSVASIMPVKSNKLTFFAKGICLEKGKLAYSEKTGLFKVVFNDNSFMYVAKWFAGIGKNRIVESMFGTEDEVWHKFLNMSRRINKRRVKPKIGVYTVSLNDFGLYYEKFKKIPNNTIYHNELNKIKNSVNYYFSHVSNFMKYNQAGRRTILIYGEPGTSKTSTLYKLALEHKNDKSVCFFTDISVLMEHVKLCEKYTVPTLAFLEDCDSVLAYNNPTIKGFLSGMYAGKNRGGTCLIFTTNYPDRLEETIIERPERVDEMYYIGPISGAVLVACARYYFGTHAPEDDILRSVLTKSMTGAEVKLFVENTLRYCASAQKEINKETLDIVLNNYRDDVKQLQSFIKKQPHKTFVKMSEDNDTMGFTKTQGRHITNWQRVNS